MTFVSPWSEYLGIVSVVDVAGALAAASGEGVRSGAAATLWLSDIDDDSEDDSEDEVPWLVDADREELTDSLCCTDSDPDSLAAAAADSDSLPAADSLADISSAASPLAAGSSPPASSPLAPCSSLTPISSLAVDSAVSAVPPDSVARPGTPDSAAAAGPADSDAATVASGAAAGAADSDVPVLRFACRELALVSTFPLPSLPADLSPVLMVTRAAADSLAAADALVDAAALAACAAAAAALSEAAAASLPSVRATLPWVASMFACSAVTSCETGVMSAMAHRLSSRPFRSRVEDVTRRRSDSLSELQRWLASRNDLSVFARLPAVPADRRGCGADARPAARGAQRSRHHAPGRVCPQAGPAPGP